ncbi:MAG: cobalamin-dependent protein [Planctomycetes bacterium]|nr:cobalamin-dependent protein [Planctomycetota bacterium]
MSAPRSLDLLLVNPGGHRRIYQNLGTNLAAKEPPIWAGLLATHARLRGRSVQILDANALDLTPDQVGAAVAALRPKLTVVVVYGHNPNASTFVMPGAGDACRAIAAADPDGRRMLLGGHVAALPERTLREEAVDFVCSGEGPYTIADLLGALDAGGGTAELRKVRGLLWWDGPQLVANPAAPLVRDLPGEMPGVAWDLLDMRAYRAHNWHCFGRPSREPYAALYTTLGCPFQCTFCCIQAPFKSGEAAAGFDPSLNSYRRFDPRHVVAQMTNLVDQHGITNFKIADELFLLDKKHVGPIVDGLAALRADLNLWAYARVDTCRDQELLERMRAGGVRWLALGIESASERVRADVDKGYRPEAIQRAVANVRAAGIAVMGNYIFGLPEDDQASMRQTLDFAKELNTEFANFFSAMAYPGSQLYRDAVQRGWPLPSRWSGYSQHSKDCLPLPTKHLSGGEVLAFRDAAFREYFVRPEYQAMVQRTFGAAAADEVRGMLGEPLARDHARPVLVGAP